MVSKIITGKSIQALIDYNEQKVHKGEARLIDGQSMEYGQPYDELTYGGKIGTFERLVEGKQNTQHEKVALHVSLNFDPSEKPTDEQMRGIASKYMDKLGYGNQPYLVYRHEDTHHAHLHIVSSTVGWDGKKIDDKFNHYRSESIRKELEQEYNLVKASEKKAKTIDELSPVDLKAISYGTTEIKKAISEIVRPVVNQYKLTSIGDLQAVLRQYNIKAEVVAGENMRGPYSGLVFSVTDEKGKRIGTGIKASGLYSKPTLQKLDARFEHNKAAKKEISKRTVAAIEGVMKSYQSITAMDLKKALSGSGIQVQYHEGRNGTFGVTFIDHTRKAVFKGSELGSGYSWNNFKKRLGDVTVEKPVLALMDTAMLKGASSSLATVYGKLKKDARVGEYFESRFIRKMDALDLVTPLLAVRPELSEKQAEAVVSEFRRYKESKLGEIERKEGNFFAAGVQTALRFLAQAPSGEGKAGAKEKLQFLDRNLMQVQLTAASAVITHRHGPHLAVPISRDVFNRLVGEGPLPEITSRKPYSKSEKAFITAIAQGGATGFPGDLKEVNHQYFPYGQFKPLLSEANAAAVAAHLTQGLRTEVAAYVGGSGSAYALAAELARRGLQVVPVEKAGKVQDYRLQYFQYPEGALPVAAGFRQALLKENYHVLPTPASARYAVLVGLQQSLDRKDASWADRALWAIGMRNKPFAEELRKELGFISKDAAIPFVMDKVLRYPTDNLREEKLLDASRGRERGPAVAYGAEEKESTMTIFDLFASNSKEGVEGDHRKNRLKRKRRIS